MLKLPLSLKTVASYEQLGRASQIRNRTTKPLRGLLNAEIHKYDYQKNHPKYEVDEKFEKLLDEAEHATTSSVNKNKHNSLE